MLDFTFEKIIIAYTAGELMEKLSDIDDDIPIKPKAGLWAGVYGYERMKDTFTDAFDYTVYQHEIFNPVKEDGEFCLGLYVNDGNEFFGHRLVHTAGELKESLKNVPPELIAVSVDDDFELGGAITEKIKLILIRKADGLTLEYR